MDPVDPVVQVWWYNTVGHGGSEGVLSVCKWSHRCGRSVKFVQRKIVCLTMYEDHTSDGCEEGRVTSGRLVSTLRWKL